jgi:hypothetical protein
MYRFSFFLGSLQGFSHRAKYDGHLEGLSGVSFTGSVLILHWVVKVWLMSRAFFLLGSSKGFLCTGGGYYVLYTALLISKLF